MIPYKILILGITVCLVFTGIIIFIDTIDVTDVQAQPTVRNTLYVGGVGSGNYSSIQDAIDDANNGDTVFIYTGTYHERIIVNQTITIRGEERKYTTINGTFGGTNGTVVKIYANGVCMENVTVKDSGGGWGYDYAGVKIYSSYNTISNCAISQKWDGDGINLINSENNMIINCSIIQCYTGIYSDSNSNNTISQCNISHNAYGIRLWGQNNIIEKCIFFRNTGSIVASGNNNTICHCDIIGTPSGSHFGLSVSNGIIYNCNIICVGYGIYAGHNLYLTKSLLKDNSVGIHMDQWSYQNHFEDCTISTNYKGIICENSNNNLISNCIIKENINYGISFEQSQNNTIINCYITDNTEWGIVLSDCYNNTITGNIINNSNYGIDIDSSTSNTNRIYHNNFINNTHHAYDNGTNSWNNDYPSGGNYWDDYTGSDMYHGPHQNISGSDGFGDTPYNITNGGNQDRYPLMDPVIFMELGQGWNLITVPFENNWSAETLGQNISMCTVVTLFNASTQTFLTHVIGTSHDDFPINGGVGYFVYCTTDHIFSIYNQSITSVNITIYENWNLIGWYHDYTTTAESLGDNITGSSVVIMFDSETQMFVTHVINTPHDNFNIERGMGLFIYTSESSIWQGEG